jgi:hypothetical protein
MMHDTEQRQALRCRETDEAKLAFALLQRRLAGARDLKQVSAQ